MRSMKTVVAGALLTASMTPLMAASPATAAEPCVSGAEVRTQVLELVAGLTDDVHSDAARAAIKKALLESLRTYRGASADTASERRAIGEEIATLARRQAKAETRLEETALSAAILALVEQREVGRFTAEEREELRSALAQVRRGAVARTSNAAEGQEVAEAFKAIHAQFNCAP